MKAITTKDLKIQFLGITPYFEDKTGILTPQQIVSLSALLTFKGKSVKKLLAESKKKGENLNKKIKTILRKSSLRGHASIATTPSLCFAFESSKFLDSALSGIVFSSSLMASGRRTDTTINDIVFPSQIFSHTKAKGIYKKTSKKIIDSFNSLLKAGLIKDEASRILQYGIYGTGIIQLPIESIVGLKREYEAEKNWMPEEVGILLRKIGKESTKLGINWLLATRQSAPRNTYPYPNIFKNPKNSNIVRELRKKEKLTKVTKIISIDAYMIPALKKELSKLKNQIKEISQSLNAIKKHWFEVLNLRQKIVRDYNLSLRFKVLSSIPWRVWGEKKRHRTVPMISESVYYCIERAAKLFKRFESQIQKKKISQQTTEKINQFFNIPRSVSQDNKLFYLYLETALEAFKTYNQLLRLGIKASEAIFIIPRALKIDVLQDYDLYNLIAGYYPLRLCSTAEEQMRVMSLQEEKEIRKILKAKGLNWLNQHIGPKCETVCFCPEEKSCGWIKSLVKDYNERFHQVMKQDLEERFQERLKEIRSK